MHMLAVTLLFIIYQKLWSYKILTPMVNEPNTLSMNVAHVKGNPSESYVVEVYKDTAALETHRKSEHFQNYINEVGSKLTNRKLYDVQPLLLIEKPNALSLINDGQSASGPERGCDR